LVYLLNSIATDTLNTRNERKNSIRNFLILYSTFVSLVKYFCCGIHIKQSCIARDREQNAIKKHIKINQFFPVFGKLGGDRTTSLRGLGF
jgi:hypothetical protein